MAYYLTVNIEAAGMPTASGGSSAAGHMWYSLDDGSGNPPSNYGFGPLRDATGMDRVIGQGRPYRDDDSYYQGAPTYSQPTEITEDQYNAMKAFGDDPTANGNFDLWYDVGDNSCVDFVYKALELGGLNPMGLEGSLIPMDNKSTINYLLTGMYVYLGGADLLAEIQQLFNTASVTPSPIILDMDGDGVETMTSGDGAYFDHDGNGFAEQTGWASSDDGLLVMDRNGDGVINDGKELFGDQTILANGQKASNGFQALTELDTNADGKIDTNDAAYSQLKIWQDLDGNGYSAADELFTLSELNIASINTGYTTSTFVDSNGNAHEQIGSFTKSDGSTATATDVWFKADKMYTIVNEWLDVPEDIAGLPDLQGYGNVYDLHQAIVRDASGHLKDLVRQFTIIEDASARHLLVTQILYAWAGVENIDPESRAATMIYGNAIGDARKLATLEAVLGENYYGTWCWGERDPNPHGPASAILLQAFDDLAGSVYGQLMLQSHFKPLLESIGMSWNSADNRLDINVSAAIDQLQADYIADPGSGLLIMDDFADTLQVLGDVGLQMLEAFRAQGDPQGVDVFSQHLAVMGYNPSTGDADDNTLLGGNDSDLLYGMGGNDSLYGYNGNDYLDGGVGNDYLDGGTGNDIYMFSRGDGQDTLFDSDDTAGNIDTIRFGEGITPADIIFTHNCYDLILVINGTTDSITISNWSAGNAYQIERLQFADGSIMTKDEIERKAVITGTEGDDILPNNYSGFVTNDIIMGGKGNDTLYGGEGNDTYIFRRGDGQDIISDYDTTAGNRDTISLASDIVPDDVILWRNQFNLYLSIKDTNDRITVQNWFNDPAYLVERVEFADGTVWDAAFLANAPYFGTDSADYLSGTSYNETLIGQGGNDTLYGDYGNDILDGGTGDDALQGGAGDDVYLFGRGYGQDTISDYDYANGSGQDTIRLAADINPSDVILRRDASNLYISINGTNDQITVQSWFSDPSYRVEHLEFADGTVWDYAMLADAPYLGTDGADYLSGTSDNETLIGKGGDDTLYGGEGNDTLDGGAGDDILQGDTGDDAYLFGRGYGRGDIGDALYIYTLQA